MAVRLAAAADATLGAFFPPDTKAVIGFRLKALSGAGLFHGIDTEIRKNASGVFEKSPLEGFDPLKDLDEVVIASSGVGETAPAIVVMRGRFPIDKLDASATRYRNAAILESPNPKQANGVLALIDGSTAIAGEAAHVRAAIDRMGEEIEGKAPWIPRMEALRSKCAIWGFGDELESTGAPGKPGDLSSIDRFEFGIGFERGLKLAAEIHARTPEDAAKMTTSLKLIEAMLKGQKKTAKSAGFDMRVDDKGTLRFSLILPEAEMKKAMQEEKGSLMAAISSGMPALIAARPMKALSPSAAAPEAAPAPPPAAHRPGTPGDSRIVTNAEGDTVVLTLPGNVPAKP